MSKRETDDRSFETAGIALVQSAPAMAYFHALGPDHLGQAPPVRLSASYVFRSLARGAPGFRVRARRATEDRVQLPKLSHAAIAPPSCLAVPDTPDLSGDGAEYNPVLQGGD